MTFECFSNICPENSSLIKICQEKRYCIWRPMGIYENISLNSS